MGLPVSIDNFPHLAGIGKTHCGRIDPGRVSLPRLRESTFDSPLTLDTTLVSSAQGRPLAERYSLFAQDNMIKQWHIQEMGGFTG